MKVETLVNPANTLEVTTDKLLRNFVTHDEDIYTLEDSSLIRYLLRTSSILR